MEPSFRDLEPTSSNRNDISIYRCSGYTAALTNSRSWTRRYEVGAQKSRNVLYPSLAVLFFPSQLDYRNARLVRASKGS